MAALLCGPVDRCPKHVGAIVLVLVLINIHSSFVARRTRGRISTYPVRGPKPIRFAAPPKTPLASLYPTMSDRISKTS